jgi:outer membrane lipoprotein-sorting protein
MKRNFIILLLLAIPLMLSKGAVRAQEPNSAYEIFERSLQAMEKVKSASYTLNIKERIDGRYYYDHYLVKMQTDPFKTYVYSVKPNPGAEALYLEGCNNGKCLINPNRFPFINLNLSPHSMLLRKNHQYNILQMGFDYMHGLLTQYVSVYGSTFVQMISRSPDTEAAGKTHYNLVIDNPSFGYKNYTVQEGETVVMIGEKLRVNDHMILEINPEIDDYEDVKKGQVIKVPNSFARKIILRIDKKTLLPLAQTVYDEKGLYSVVEFSNFIINPNLTDADFSPENPKYGF